MNRIARYIARHLPDAVIHDEAIRRIPGDLFITPAAVKAGERAGNSNIVSRVLRIVGMQLSIEQGRSPGNVSLARVNARFNGPPRTCRRPTHIPPTGGCCIAAPTQAEAAE